MGSGLEFKAGFSLGNCLGSNGRLGLGFDLGSRRDLLGSTKRSCLGSSVGYVVRSTEKSSVRSGFGIYQRL